MFSPQTPAFGLSLLAKPEVNPAFIFGKERQTSLVSELLLFFFRLLFGCLNIPFWF